MSIGALACAVYPVLRGPAFVCWLLGQPSDPYAWVVRAPQAHSCLARDYQPISQAFRVGRCLDLSLDLHPDCTPARRGPADGVVGSPGVVGKRTQNFWHRFGIHVVKHASPAILAQSRLF